MEINNTTLCKDESCPMNTACYRFIEADNEDWMSLFKTSPRDGNKCEYQIR